MTTASRAHLELILGEAESRIEQDLSGPRLSPTCDTRGSHLSLHAKDHVRIGLLHWYLRRDALKWRTHMAAAGTAWFSLWERYAKGEPVSASYVGPSMTWELLALIAIGEVAKARRMIELVPIDVRERSEATEYHNVWYDAVVSLCRNDDEATIACERFAGAMLEWPGCQLARSTASLLLSICRRDPEGVRAALPQVATDHRDTFADEPFTIRQLLCVPGIAYARMANARGCLPSFDSELIPRSLVLLK